MTKKQIHALEVLMELEPAYPFQMIRYTQHNLSEGTLYNMLQIMENRGLVVSEKEPKKRGLRGLGRRFYQTTELGRFSFNYWQQNGIEVLTKKENSTVKNIIVVGLGALGSHFIQIGRNLKVQFTGIDFDRVEQKNLASQFHTRMSLNKNKAQALQQTMKGLYGINMKAIPHKLTADNVAQLLGEADVVIDCLDNGPSRRIVQAFVREKGIECLHGALAADGQFGSVLWDHHFKVDDEDVEGQPTCDGGEFLSFILDVASAMVRCLQDYLEKGKKTGMQMWPYNKILV